MGCNTYNVFKTGLLNKVTQTDLDCCGSSISDYKLLRKVTHTHLGSCGIGVSDCNVRKVVVRVGAAHSVACFKGLEFTRVLSCRCFHKQHVCE